MSKHLSHFLNLPLELRNQIYSYALIVHQPEIPCTVKGSSVVWHAKKPIYQRPRAFLKEEELSDHSNATLVCPLALSKVNRQLRTEFSDFLRTASVDIVSRVRNFDCSRVIHFIQSLPDSRKNQFLVAEDGGFQNILYFELGGPYTPDWRTNLMCWIEFVESWTQAPNQELKTLHKTIQDLSTSDPWCRAPPGAIVRDVLRMHQSHKKGIGQLELEKVFYTLLGRYRVEIILKGGPPQWVRDWPNYVEPWGNEVHL